MFRTASFGFLLMLAFAAAAAAQTGGGPTTPDGGSHWGVTVSFVPSWKVPSNVTYLYDDASAFSIEGSEFSIGVARGKTYGGDWGFTYIRRSFKDGSYIDNLDQSCFGNSGCFETGTHYTLTNVVLNGIEAHKFVNFATIKRRAQVGLIVGGGIAWESGLMQATTKTPSFTQNGGFVIVESTDQVKYTDVFLSGTLSVVPLFQFELGVNAILAPGLKVRFSGGYNFPGYQVARISAVYLIGAK